MKQNDTFFLALIKTAVIVCVLPFFHTVHVTFNILERQKIN